MEPIPRSTVFGFYSYERLFVIVLALLAVLSPLYIDRSSTGESEGDEEEPFNFTFWLLLLFFMLLMAIILSLYLDQSLGNFDPYWIYRVSGSSVGILATLALLVLVLKFKAYIKCLED